MIPLLFTLVLDASAADPSAFPRMAQVELPAEGVARIRVPPDLRTPADPPDGSDLLLVDANGRTIPIARILAADAETIRPSSHFRVRPTTDPDVWTLEVRSRPIDGIRVELPLTSTAATVRVEAATESGEWTLLAEQFIWNTPNGTLTDIPLEQAALGTLRASFRWHSRSIEDPLFSGLIRRGPLGDPDQITVEVPPPIKQTNGWSRYPIELPRPLPIQEIVLQIDDPVIHRQAGLVLAPEQPRIDDWSSGDLWPDGRHTLSRVQIGQVQIDSLTLPPPSSPRLELSGAHLALLIEDRSQPPLNVQSATLVLPPSELVVQDAGPGPHTMYGGAPPNTSTRFDLGLASHELGRIAGEALEVGEAQDNPDYVPPEIRSGLTEPGSTLTQRNHRWVHAIDGPPGLVRIPLPAEIFSGARSDLGDLRLLDPEDRQVPFILSRRSRDHRTISVPFTRTERGTISTLRVPLDIPEAPVSTVTLTSEASIFQRQVTLSRPQGGRLLPVRAATWVGSETGGRLTLAINHILGDELVIEIENGDDAPLSLEEVQVAWPAWELWTVLPEEEVRLVYGDPTLHRPDFDLALLRQQIQQRVALDAEVGPAQRHPRREIPTRDRLLVATGLGALSLTLIGLLVRLLNTPRREDPPEAPTPDDAAPIEPAG